MSVLYASMLYVNEQGCLQAEALSRKQPKSRVREAVSMLYFLMLYVNEQGCVNAVLSMLYVTE